MEDFVSFFIVLICITIFYIYLEGKSLDVTFVKVNNEDTFLVRNKDDKEEAAKLLSDIKNNLQKIVDKVVEDKEADQEDIDRLKKNFRPKNISESSPGNKYTSYSINKGEKIVFCIRSKVDDKLEDLNTMMFVAIHELAHLMTKSIGHEPEFWNNMKYLLTVGKKIGVYKKQDFKNNPVDYCGTKITNTPEDD